MPAKKNMLSLVNCLLDRASHQGDREAYRFIPRQNATVLSITYAELDQRARAIAAFLQGRCASGDRVILFYPPGLEYICAFMGCLYAGMVAVPLYPPRAKNKRGRVDNVIVDCAPKLALTDAVSLSPMVAFLGQLSSSLPVHASDTIPSDRGGEWRQPQVKLTNGQDHRLAFLQYTSGSTGTPKGVMVSHHNLIANEEAIGQGFETRADDICVSWLPMYHDMGLIGTVLHALYRGFTSILLPGLVFVRDPIFWLEVISENRATLSGAPNFAYELCAHRITPERMEGLNLSSWRVAFNGSEPVRARTQRLFADTFAVAGFKPEAQAPCYGMAETTLYVSSGPGSQVPVIRGFDKKHLEENKALPVESGESALALVSCGQTRHDHEVCIVDPQTLLVCESGSIGEIWVHGPSIARGYWNREELNQEIFNARIEGRGDRWLRTGDLGFCKDGELYITGRLKDLIIIRGRNFYPQDLEQASVSAHALCRADGTAAFTVDGPEGEMLIIVQELQRGEFEGDELIAAIRAVVSEQFDILVEWVVLVKSGRIPRTSSGKIRRSSCREEWLAGDLQPVFETQKQIYVEALSLTPSELKASAEPESLLTRWFCSNAAELLKTDPSKITSQSSLTSLGMDSMTAIAFDTRLLKQTGLRLSMVKALSGANLSELAQAALSSQEEDSIETVERDVFPLSFNQSALWAQHKWKSESSVSNISVAMRVRFRQDWTVENLVQSIHRITSNRSVLRTTFHGHEQRVQNIELSLERVSSNELGSEDVRTYLSRRANEPFDLESAPPVRWVLLEEADGGHILLFVIHHIASDLWSVQAMFQELFDVTEPTSDPGYASYVADLEAMIEGSAGDKMRKFWLEQLARPVLELPSDHPQPADRSFNGGIHNFTISEAVTQRLHGIAKAEQTTLYVVLLTAWQTLLYRYTGQAEFLTGVPFSGRDTASRRQSLGYFVNIMPLATELDSHKSFKSNLAKTRQNFLCALSHSEYPFQSLVKASGKDAQSLLRTVFTLQQPFAISEVGAFALEQPGARIELINATLESVPLERKTSPFDLTLYAAPVDSGLLARVEFNSDLFEKETIERLSEHFKTLVHSISSNPDTAISDLSVTTEAAQVQTVFADQQRTPVHVLVEQQAAQYPQAPAIRFHNESLSYERLNRRANALARRLLETGLRPGDRVAILAERTPEMVVAMLAVQKSGAAWLPLDPDHPNERLVFSMADSGSKVLLAHKGLADKVSEYDGTVFMLDDLVGEAENLDLTIYPQQTAYLIYTSGTTGAPKGVCVPHSSLANLISWHRRAFEISCEDRASHLAGPAFDASVWEVWPYLAAGATVVLTPDQYISEPEKLVDWFGEQCISIGFLPTPLAEAMMKMDLPKSFKPRLILTGGDKLHQCPPDGLCFDVINNYGPTENAVVATSGKVVEGQPTAPSIGCGIDDVDIHILDRHGKPSPRGGVGELCISGASLARGYHNNPSKTAAAFRPHPLAFGERVYHSGDLTRLRNDGELSFLGRCDRQVQIRGYRIEPGEIEVVATRHCDVSLAAAIVKSNRIVLFVQGNPCKQELGTYLRLKLPTYMVPTYLINLNQMPLTHNGKIDYNALNDQPLPEMVGQPPHTETEKQLAQIWEDLLGIYPDLDSEFFELGGHSLLAASAAARIRDHFNVEYPVRDVFTRPGFAAMAKTIDQANRLDDLPPVTVRTDDQGLPLSFAQERLWFLDQMGGNGALFVIPAALKLEGPLNADILQQCFETMVERHEVLRTAFRSEGGKPVQQIMDQRPPRFEMMSIHHESDLAPIAEQIAKTPFDLEKDSLLRIVLVRLKADTHFLMPAIHHIVADGWSSQIILRELASLYESFTQGSENPLKPLPVQYTDFAIWQRDHQCGQDDAWWRSYLEGAPSYISLPTDYQRPPLQTYNGLTTAIDLPAKQLDTICKSKSVTPFIACQAAFALMLGHYSGQNDIVIGAPVANRDRMETEDLIGLFVNMLPMRHQLANHQTFSHLLTQSRECILESYNHQNTPFERIVDLLDAERSTSHSPIFQVMFTLRETIDEPMDWGDVSATPVHAFHETAKYDLSLTIEGSKAHFTFNSDLFEPESIERMAQYYQGLCDQVFRQPDKNLYQMNFLPEAQSSLLDQWNHTPAAYPEQASLQGLFEAQVLRTPYAVALEFGNQTLTYAQLNARSNRLAHWLKEQGVCDETPVGLCLLRSFDMVVAIYAILKAGGYYVPIDPDYPSDRIEFMLSDAQTPLLLTSSSLLPVLPQHGSRSIALDLLDLSSQLNTNPGPGDAVAAYMIYTSGSTGKPKGVVNHHRALSNRLNWMQNTFQLTPADRVIQKTPFSFDVSVWEFFWPLMTGATLVIAEPQRHGEPAYLIDVICSKKITLLHFVPSMLAAFLADAGASACRSIRAVICSGEALGFDLAQRCSEILPHSALHNLYGPTEAAIDVTWWPCSEDAHGKIPIGRPIDNTQIHILDAHGGRLPIGAPGLLHIGGVNPARGYHGRASLTAERFIPDPFGEAGARLYNTGDLARWHHGYVEYLGRVDHQVKLRGFRIELGEIEAVINRVSGVGESVVLPYQQDHGNQFLVAYVRPDEEPDETLRHHIETNLQEHLPNYMVPSIIMFVEEMPLTPNGKLDRKTLPKPEAMGTTEYVAPRNETEEKLARIWSEVLGVDRVGVKDPFFRLGGHSLLATQVISRIQEDFGVKIALSKVFEQPTVAGLSNLIENLQWANAPALVGVDEDIEDGEI